MPNKTFVSTGLTLIAEERLHQLGEGKTAAHDQMYSGNQLVKAAIAYALPGPQYLTIGRFESLRFERESFFEASGWGFEHWKPKTRIEDLARAGALIAAEIDRLLELEKVKK